MQVEQTVSLQVEKKAQGFGLRVEEMGFAGFWSRENQAVGHGILPGTQSASGAKHEIGALFSCFECVFVRF
jgi:hypothetical protein